MAKAPYKHLSPVEIKRARRFLDGVPAYTGTLDTDDAVLRALEDRERKLSHTPFFLRLFGL